MRSEGFQVAWAISRPHVWITNPPLRFSSFFCSRSFSLSSFDGLVFIDLSDKEFYVIKKRDITRSDITANNYTWSIAAQLDLRIQYTESIAKYREIVKYVIG